MKAVLVFAFVVLAVLAVLLGLTSVASADGSVNWDGHGLANLPCVSGAHWVLSPAQGITGAFLTVNGTRYTMHHQNGNGSWAADSNGPLDNSLSAIANYTGDFSGNGTPSLQLSHCVGGNSTNTPVPPTATPMPPTNTPVPPTVGPSPTPTSTSTAGPSPTPTTEEQATPKPTATLVAGTPLVPSTGGSDGYWPIFVPVAAIGLLFFLALSVVGKRR